ncbi:MULTISPECIES: cation:proton antiporter [Kitasatospora]|uniref:Putative sodium/proton antiporter n=1 Tax=Kitasatospora setae (strain ATCC 33774 / DSM 43861 / JCM 3304 / KCC A-0304 / NBRC 14216 / KM-6054) TaxID=452652 RepID=E4N6J8_KITSK|nr:MULTISPECIES: cation:proton antiporter [Kitasatospora]BAJ26829.1 putative sodium/proton antiporter [Kitasatospora setae KM-6054]
MTSEQILIGSGLTVVLAVASQLLAARLRIPAIIVLLPVGFAAGAVTDDVHPDRLLGAAFSPLVSLAVAVILYDAGLGLDLRKLTGHTRHAVVRLVWVGTLVTAPAAAFAAAPLLGMSGQAAAMLGAILVVSGPTVVGPLLNFVRPTERVQRILVWEGSLIDAVGGILGALVFHALVEEQHRAFGLGLLEFVLSVGLGLLGGLLGAAVLWGLLVRVRLGEVLGTSAQLAAVVGVAALCDALREDTGLIAAIVMGVVVATVPAFDLPARRTFFETLVSLVVGVLFVSISSTVTWASVQPVLLPSLGLTAVLVVLVRPVVAALSTAGTDLAEGERAFLGWMAPRGIVAASTAATFSAGLAAAGIGGAERILPATFLVIVLTVTLYGLTAVPVARLLRVTRPARSRPLLVGGEPWTVELATVLRSAGLDVLLWAGRDEQRARISAAGLELADGELLATASGEGAEQEGVTAVYLLTAEDEFNALAAAVLDEEPGIPVFRLPAAASGPGVVGDAPAAMLLPAALTGPELARRHAAGARILRRPADGALPPGHDLLFTLDRAGHLHPATLHGEAAHPDQVVERIVLGPA